MEAARKYPAMHEVELKDQEHYQGLIELTKADENIVPIFLKTPEGDLKIISSFSTEFNDIEAGSRLAYLGKRFDVEAPVTPEKKVEQKS